MSGGRKIALVAGGGSLPLEVAAACTEPLIVMRLKGFASAALRNFPGEEVDIFQPRRFIEALKRHEVTHLAMAGYLHRPGPSAILSATQTSRERREFDLAASGGDDTLLRRVIATFESQGVLVLGLHELAPELLAPPRVLTTRKPDAAGEESIEYGMGLLSVLGTFDVGQACVASRKRVLAIEGAEGTRMMLERVAMLRASGPIAWMRRGFRATLGEKSGGVLIKAPKPEQDMRVDMPVIGPKTIVEAKAAGLDGIAVAAGGVLILEREKTVAAANRTGLFLVGVPT